MFSKQQYLKYVKQQQQSQYQKENVQETKKRLYLEKMSNTIQDSNTRTLFNKVCLSGRALTKTERENLVAIIIQQYPYLSAQQVIKWSSFEICSFLYEQGLLSQLYFV